MTATDTQNGIDNAEDVINRFGGIRPMARKMDVPVTTVQGWKKRNFIPEDRVQEVVDAAAKHKVSLDGISFETTANQNTKGDDDAPMSFTETQKAVMDSPVKPRPRPESEQPRTSTNNTYTRPAYDRQNVVLDATMIKREAVTRSIISTVCILGVLGITGWFLFGKEVQEVSTLARDQRQTEIKINGLSDKFASFETTVTKGLNDLGAHITDIGAAVGVERNEDGQIILNNDLSISERVTALESRLRSAGEEIDLGQMMNRFETLTQSVGGQGEMDAAMADLKTVIASIQGRMGELDMALEKAKEDNDALARSLENVTGRDLSAAAMLLTLTQFRSSMNREEPFAEDLQTLQELVGDDDPELTAAINRLAPHAQSGVLSPAGLKEELKTITGDIVMAKLSGEDVSFKDRVVARIGQILSVEKDGKPVIAIEEQEIIAEAQDYLDKGDVASAMQTLNKLEGDAAKAAQPFQKKAAGTLAAQNAEAVLLQTFLDRLSNPRPQAEPEMPAELQKLMDSIPTMLPGQKSVKEDPASGIIILE